MALTKDTTAASLMSAVTVVPGTPQDSSAQATGYGASLIATITNGGTGPTVPASATLQVSADTSTWYSTADVRTASATASEATPFDFNLGLADYANWAFARIRIGGNTGQNVTGNVVASHTSSV